MQSMQELPSLEEFQSLPPALRRKLFSSVERFRIQLALADHGHDLEYRPTPIGRSENLHYRHRRTRSPLVLPVSNNNNNNNNNSSPDGRRCRLRMQKKFSSSRKQRRRCSFRVSYLKPPADAQWFLSLPPKIQQTQFSKEEQFLLRQARRQSSISDAVDQSFYQSDKEFLSHPFLVGKEEEENCFSWSETTSPVTNRPPSAFLDTSDDSSSCSSGDMNDSLLDSFRRLDGDGNLDLSLGNYHVNTPSTLSSRTPSRLSSIAERSPRSRPSLNYQPSQRVRRSTTSVQPDAQYVQDPEARLKLRVYLSSPQKFDEAVEFGFPALENEDKSQSQKQNKNKNKSIGLNIPPTETKPNKYVLTGTFFKDDDASTLRGAGEKDRPTTLAAAATTTTTTKTAPPATAPGNYHRQKSSSTTTSLDIRRQQQQQQQPCMPSTKKPVTQRDLGNREMTMKMTLTRPDLRTESSLALPSTDDPLKMDELPPADTSTRPPWEMETDDEQGGMKKIWHKLRKRVCRQGPN